MGSRSSNFNLGSTFVKRKLLTCEKSRQDFAQYFKHIVTERSEGEGQVETGLQADIDRIRSQLRNVGGSEFILEHELCGNLSELPVYLRLTKRDQLAMMRGQILEEQIREDGANANFSASPRTGEHPIVVLVFGTISMLYIIWILQGRVFNYNFSDVANPDNVDALVKMGAYYRNVARHPLTRASWTMSNLQWFTPLTAMPCWSDVLVVLISSFIGLWVLAPLMNLTKAVLNICCTAGLAHGLAGVFVRCDPVTFYPSLIVGLLTNGWLAYLVETDVIQERSWKVQGSEIGATKGGQICMMVAAALVLVMNILVSFLSPNHTGVVTLLAGLLSGVLCFLMTFRRLRFLNSPIPSDMVETVRTNGQRTLWTPIVAPIERWVQCFRYLHDLSPIGLSIRGIAASIAIIICLVLEYAPNSVRFRSGTENFESCCCCEVTLEMWRELEDPDIDYPISLKYNLCHECDLDFWANNYGVGRTFGQLCEEESPTVRVLTTSLYLPSAAVQFLPGKITWFELKP